MVRYIPSLGKNKFVELEDTPASYSGQAGKVPAVKSTEDGLEFTTLPERKWNVVAEVTVDADCDYIDFTGLDINTDKEYILFANIKNPTADNSVYYIFVEGDYTTTNYYTQYIYAAGTSVSANRPNNPQILYVTAGNGGMARVFITKDPDGYFRWESLANRDAPDTVRLVYYVGAKTATVSNITSIRIAASVAGAIGANSYFLLCKPRG